MMAAPQNKLKQALLAGQTQIGIWLAFGSPAIADMAGGQGFDWCLIDGEHSPNDPADMLAQLQAMAGRGAEAVVRVPVGEDWVIKRALDLGAQTVMVPMVETARQAEQVSRAMRYPPEGIRGVGATIARAAGYGTMPDYVRTANEQVCLIVQVESRAALAAIPEIAAVDGVDVIFIGPADLAADMGYLGQKDVPEVEEAIADALGAITGAGKVAGILAFDMEAAARYAEQGATFVGVGADVSSLRTALDSLVAQARDRLEG